MELVELEYKPLFQGIELTVENVQEVARHFRGRVLTGETSWFPIVEVYCDGSGYTRLAPGDWIIQDHRKRVFFVYGHNFGNEWRPREWTTIEDTAPSLKSSSFQIADSPTISSE